MPYELGWQVKQRIIYRRYYGDITLEEIQQSSDEAREMVEQGTPLVHSVIDASEITGYPGLRDLQRSAHFETSEAEGWQMIIGVTGVARLVVSVLTQITGKRFRIVDSVDEAMNFLMMQDETLAQPNILKPQP